MKEVHPLGWAVVALVAIVILVLGHGFVVPDEPRVNLGDFVSYAFAGIGIVVGLFSDSPRRK